MLGWGAIFIYFIYMWSSKRYSLYPLLMRLLAKLHVKPTLVLVGPEPDILWNTFPVKVVRHTRHGSAPELAGAVEIRRVVYHRLVDEVVSSA